MAKQIKQLSRNKSEKRKDIHEYETHNLTGDKYSVLQACKGKIQFYILQ